jgi:uncharacterized protein YqgC (DUF456 family)
MEIFLVVLAFLFLLVGLIGSVVPALPGPPLSFIGLLLLQWSGHGNFSPAFLWMWAAITVAVTIIDNILPAWMTKKFGGSRAAVIGSVLGLIAGIVFFAPIGLLVGPFLGAFAGELINDHIHAKRKKINNTEVNSTGVDSTEIDNADVNIAGDKKAGYAKAFKAALGAFLAFIVGTGAKLIVGALMIYFAVKAVFL